ncbi:hypothetical protein D3C71_1802950 [compost metagenome]
MIFRQLPQGWRMGYHQMGDAQHIQCCLGRRWVGFDIGQGFTAQIRQAWWQRQHPFVEIEGDVEPEG